MAVVDVIRPPAAEPEVSTAATPALDAPPRRWKFTGDDLIRMGEAGILPPEAKFELLDGEVYQIMPPSPLHAILVTFAAKLLEELALAAGGHVRDEKPIRLADTYDPQPDVAVVRGGILDYPDRFPAPEDVLLLVEICLSSIEHDRTRKVPAYAAAGIQECWLVDHAERQVEIYRNAVDGQYRELRIVPAGETLRSLAAADVAIEASALLGEELGGAAA
jgi:Uma2 family endonuclease